MTIHKILDGEIVILITLVSHGGDGKVADAELHFRGGLLDGLKLIGFSIWERRNDRRNFNVTFPARTYSINGERRSFALLRPSSDTPQHHNAQLGIRDAIISAYRDELHARSIEQAEQAQGVQ